jgi:hypothetical protein
MGALKLQEQKTDCVRLAYQPPASSTFLSEQISHQQPASSTLLSEQTSTSHQPPANRTGCGILLYPGSISLFGTVLLFFKIYIYIYI